MPPGLGVHGLLVVAHTSKRIHFQTEEIEIVGICFQPQPNFLERRIELARKRVKRGESVRP